MTLPELAIRRPIAMLMILTSIVLLGVVALFRLPLGFLPEVEEPRLFVRVPYDNATPEQVERMIVRPLEEALGSVKGVTEMWARCNQDGGMVNLRFDWGHKMHLARAEVREKIDRIRRDLPDDIGDIQVSSSWDAREAEQPILEGRLSSNRDLSESYDVLDRKVIKPLERIPGVAQVRLDGINPKEVRIDLHVANLEAHQIDIRDVTAVLRGVNFDQSLGRLTDGDRRYTVRTVGTFGSLEEIGDLPLREDGLRLRDVADVVYEEPALEYGRHLDGKFAVGVTVSKESGANAVVVCDEVKARVAAMEHDPELEGVNFLIWFNQGDEIRKTLRELTFTGIFGAILAGAVLFGFLRRFSMTAVSVLCIPFSLIVACGIIWAQGKSLNTLTLLGLIVGIGMLVDNAVVVMENIFRHQQEGLSRKRAAWVGSREVTTAVMAATLTSVIVFIPVIFNKPSEMNIYLKELGVTVCLALLASFFISQTLIPLATSRFIKVRPLPKERWLLWLEAHYLRLLRLNLRRRWMTPVVGLVVIGSALYPFQRIEKNFDFSQAEAFVQVRYRFSEELNLERTEKIIDRVEQVLLPHKEALHAKAIYSFWSDHWSMTRIYMEEGYAHEKAMAETRARIRELIPDLPGVRLSVEDPQQGFGHRGGGRRVGFEITGEDSDLLAELAEQARIRIEQIPGLADVWVSSEGGNQELYVDLDRDLASRYGVRLTQPAEVISLTYRGRRLQRFRTPDGEREMRITLDEQQRESLSQLRNLPIRTETGERIPLASMADFRTVTGPEGIQRENRKATVRVGASYQDGTREDYIPLVARALSDIAFPLGYEWSFGRWEQRHKEQSREFLTNLLLALLLIFVVMASLFESVRQAVGLMVALPFALAGAVWTLYATGVDFDQPAAIGLLLLIGVVVNNGIVMLEHINQYRRRGMPRHEAMLRGGRERMRPILMTAITTLVGLVPIVVQKPALAGIYYYSMALVLMGGLLVSTFLTAVLLPTTATLAEDVLGWIARAPGRFWAWSRGRSIRRPPTSAGCDLTT